MISGALMCISLAGLSAYVYLKSAWQELLLLDESDTVEELMEGLGWIPLFCLMSFIIAYSIGFGAVPYLIMGELFPSEYRHRLGTISTSFNYCCTFLVVRTFPEMANTLGLSGVYGLYAAFCLAAIVFVVFCLPETKGKTLEEISYLFGRCNDDKVMAGDGHSADVEQTRPLSEAQVELIEISI